MTYDFHTNKRLCDEVAIIGSKRLRNKIAGYATHCMKRIQKGPVRGISYKLQQEQREQRENYIPEFSELNTAHITLDPVSMAMLVSIGKNAIPGVVVAVPQAASQMKPGRRQI